MASSYETGCRCRECYGLAEYMLEQGKDFGLERAPGHERARLRVVTVAGRTVMTPSCDGTMTCSCERCVGERMTRVKAQRAANRRQPWMPRPARAAA